MIENMNKQNNIESMQESIKNPDVRSRIELGIRLATHTCHQLSFEAGWWHDIQTGDRKERNKGEDLALIHSEISEALEGVRKNCMDDHLPTRKMEEVELADAVIRIMDYAGGHDLDLAGAIAEKLLYNVNRADHKIENRMKEFGKAI